MYARAFRASLAPLAPLVPRLALLSALLGASVTGGCSTSQPPVPTPTPAPPASTAAPAVTAPVTTVTASATPVVSASASAVASAAPAPPPPGMLLVPAGVSVIGSDELGELDERPAHKVTLGAFWLDETEVTTEAYGKCVEAGKCRHHDEKSARANKVGDDKPFRGPRQPISAVSQDDGRAYCEWLGKRLPKEAEWERAARGDDGRLYPWGNEPATHERAVFGSGVTADVGSKPEGKGPYGHLDLAGNVWEWMDDFYDPYAYRRPGAPTGVVGTCEEIMTTLAELKREKRQGFTGSNPIPDECERVLRGGAFNYHAKGLRSSNRVHHPGKFRLVMSGFRCARDVEAAKESP